MDINDLIKQATINPMAEFDKSLEAHLKMVKETGIASTFNDMAATLIKAASYDSFSKNALSSNSIVAMAFKITHQANNLIPSLSLASDIREMLSSTNRISDSWMKAIEAVASDMQKNEFVRGIQSLISRSAEISLLAEKSLLGINEGNFASFILPRNEIKDALLKTNYSFANSFRALYKSLQNENFIGMIPSITTLPPHELYWHNRFIESTSIQRKDSEKEQKINRSLAAETEDEVEELLYILDPSLYKMWGGGSRSDRTK